MSGRIHARTRCCRRVADGWQHGPTVDKGARWAAEELDAVVAGLIDQAPVPGAVYGA